MPQMSPMLWFNLYLYFLSILVIFMSVIFFLVMFKNLGDSFKLSKIFKKLFTMKW